MQFKFLLMSFLLISIYSFSQKKEFEITFIRNDDKSVEFSFNKDNPGSAFVILKFNSIRNSNINGVVTKSVYGFSGSLIKLYPIDREKGISFSYTYSHQIGTKKYNVDEKFKYVLPFLKGKNVRVLNLSYLGKKFGNTPPKNWKSIQFLTMPNDTICAARKGIVVKIEDEIKANKNIEYNFNSKSNYILVEHADGTLAKYGVLKKNNTMVKLGDKVYPSTLIAIAGSYDKPENSQLRFSVYYLDKEVDYEFNRQQTLANQRHYYAYVNPYFYVTEGVTQLKSNRDYVAQISDLIIQHEMTKREKRKLLKKK